MSSSSEPQEEQHAIAAVVRMFSGCQDEQTSADVSNVASFQLPDAAGRAGGALTSSLLNVGRNERPKRIPKCHNFPRRDAPIWMIPFVSSRLGFPVLAPDVPS